MFFFFKKSSLDCSLGEYIYSLGYFVECVIDWKLKWHRTQLNSLAGSSQYQHTNLAPQKYVKKTLTLGRAVCGKPASRLLILSLKHLYVKL